MSESKIKVIAMNTIVKTVKAGVRGDRNKGDPGTKPQVLTIEPGTVFMADNVRHGGALVSEYDELMASSSIRDWTKADEEALNRMSNVVGGGEFTDHFKVSETVENANQGQQTLADPSGTGQQSVKKTTAPAPKQPAAGDDNKAGKGGKAPTAAEKKAAEAAAKKAADEEQAKQSAAGNQQSGENGSGEGSGSGENDDVV